MFRAHLFLATLLMADALRLPFKKRQEPPPVPPTPIAVDPQLMRMLMFWMPFTSMFMAFRAVDLSLMSGVLQSMFTTMGSVADSVSQNFGTNGLLMQLPNLIPMISNLTQNRMQQNCVFKLACELTLDRQQNTAQEMTRRQMQMQQNAGAANAGVNKNVVVNMNFDPGMVEQVNPCERRFSGCPFSLDDVLRMRKKVQDFWGRFYKPRTIIVEEDDDYDYYDY